MMKNNHTRMRTVIALGAVSAVLAIGAMNARTAGSNDPPVSNTNQNQSAEAGPPKSGLGPAAESPNGIPRNASNVLAYIAIGILLGVAGQGARVVVGLKQEMDKASAEGKKWEEWFNGQQLVVSLLLGGIAGTGYAISLLGAAVDKQFLIGGMAAGYAGADFIEGFMTKFMGALAPGASSSPRPGVPAPPSLPPLPVAQPGQVSSRPS